MGPRVDGHCDFRLEWASTYVPQKVANLLSQDAGNQILKTINCRTQRNAIGIHDRGGIISKPMSVPFRKADTHTFENKDLKTKYL